MMIVLAEGDLNTAMLGILSLIGTIASIIGGLLWKSQKRNTTAQERVALAIESMPPTAFEALSAIVKAGDIARKSDLDDVRKTVSEVKAALTLQDREYERCRALEDRRFEVIYLAVATGAHNFHELVNKLTALLGQGQLTEMRLHAEIKKLREGHKSVTEVLEQLAPPPSAAGAPKEGKNEEG